MLTLPPNIIIGLISIILGSLRVAGVTHPAFQAVAHLWVGGLFCSGYTEYGFTWTTGGKNAMFKIWVAIGLSLLEIACALWFGFVK